MGQHLRRRRLRPATSFRPGRPGHDLPCRSLDREHVRQANDRRVVRFRVLLGMDHRSPGTGGGHSLRHGPRPDRSLDRSRGARAARSQSQRGSSETGGPGHFHGAPLFWSYRNSSPFYVEFWADETGNERWYFSRPGQSSAAICITIIWLGGFGPDGFFPPGRSASASKASFDMRMVGWYTFDGPYPVYWPRLHDGFARPLSEPFLLRVRGKAW